MTANREHIEEKAPAKAGERSGSIQSLERAAAILEVIAAGPGDVSLADVCAATTLHTSTAFQLIKTMVSLGFLLQSAENKRYRIGSRLFTLAAGAMNDSALLSLGMPVLERLSRDTGEAAHLAVRSNADITLVARTAAAGMLQMSERAGAVRPAHATAIGKMLLAQMPVAEAARLIDDLELKSFTPNTITSAKRLKAELQTIREQGMAHDRGELDVDVRCVALPVTDFSGRCVAAIGISGPVWRMAPELLVIKAAKLRDAAAELSALLGDRTATVSPRLGSG